MIVRAFLPPFHPFSLHVIVHQCWSLGHVLYIHTAAFSTFHHPIVNSSTRLPISCTIANCSPCCCRFQCLQPYLRNASIHCNIELALPRSHAPRAPAKKTTPPRSLPRFLVPLGSCAWLKVAKALKLNVIQMRMRSATHSY
jgi:hypothetical protein